MKFSLKRTLVIWSTVMGVLLLYYFRLPLDNGVTNAALVPPPRWRLNSENFLQNIHTQSTREKTVNKDEICGDVDSDKDQSQSVSVRGINLTTEVPKAISSVLQHSCWEPSQQWPSLIDGMEIPFKLKQVHTFLVSGQFVPSSMLGDIVELNGSYCDLKHWLPVYGSTHQHDNVQMHKIQTFVDHMDKYFRKQAKKSSFHNWSLYPNRKKCLPSELTSVGAIQQVRVGLVFNQMFINKTNLFNPELPISSQIKIVSTGMSSAYQSTVAFLYGFLPYFNVSRVNIERSQTSWFSPLGSEKRFCLKAMHFLTASESMVKKGLGVILSKTILKRKIIGLVFAKAKGSTGPHVSSEIGNLLSLQCQCGANITAVNVNCASINHTFIEALYNIAETAQKIRKEDDKQSFKKYVAVHMYHVMLEIGKRLRDVSENRMAPKFVLYSGQYDLMSNVLTTMGINFTTPLPAASHFTIELYSNTGNSRKMKGHYVRLIYNGNDVTKQMPFCDRFLYQGLCELPRFTRYMFYDMVSRLGISPCV